MSENSDRLVYSTETGSNCPECGYPLKKCRCPDTGSSNTGNPNTASPNNSGADGNGAGSSKNQGWVRLRRETKGRKGKGVTLVDGLPLDEKALKALAKKLKQTCGTGGSLKNGVIEIQGDKRDAIEAELKKQGYKDKRAGG